MIFNKSGRKLKGYSFFYAQQSVGQASEYKYLGIIGCSQSMKNKVIPL